MKKLEDALRNHTGVHDYKINRVQTIGYQLFFVKGSLETIRCTDNTDTRVTVYVRHDGKIGDADFPVFPSTTDDQLKDAIEEAVQKAGLISNELYELPDKDCADFPAEAVAFSASDLAALTANAIFDANTTPGGSLNSVEVFIDEKHICVVNSRGLKKTQVCRTGMAEVIPTYNGESQSVELYEQYHFADLNTEDLSAEIAEMMQRAEARYQASVPDKKPQCPIVLHREELVTLFRSICRNLDYAAVYTHSGVFSKGDLIQKNASGDLLNISMCGMLPNDPKSSHFDNDGLALGSTAVIREGIAESYFGSSRYGQYLGQIPTGVYSCMTVQPGSVGMDDITAGTYLEILSMSGLQVDFFSDYIGGEIRLAYLHSNGTVLPITGISFSGSLKEALSTIRLSRNTVSINGYCGPAQAAVCGMKVF